MATPRPRGTHPVRVLQWAQEHGEVGGVLTSHLQLTDQLRAAGYLVSYVDTGSGRRALRALPGLWSRWSLHLLHVTRLWRAVVLAPVFAVLPGRTVLVLHSGSVDSQLAGMPPSGRYVLFGSLRAFDEIWAVNERIGSKLPGGLRERMRVVAPLSPRSAAPDTHPMVRRDPHQLSVATNAGLPHYNAELAVDAASTVRREWADACLKVLAYGHDGEHLASLRQRVEGLPWVELTFDAPAAVVNRVLLETGVFLRPTAWDGDSVVVREALAAGARVVASDVAPRPRGVELASLDALSFAHAVLEGGRRSDGSGLGAQSMLEVASAALELVRHGPRH